MDGKGLGRKEKEGEGINTLGTYSPSPLNISNKLATHADQPGENLSRILSRFAKNSITTRSQICRAQNSRSLATRGTIPWNNSSVRFKRTFQTTGSDSPAATHRLSDTGTVFQADVLNASNVQVQVSCVRGEGVARAWWRLHLLDQPAT